ncbi:MAG: substrate-binding domain-containing protein [Microbacterium sp.]
MNTLQGSSSRIRSRLVPVLALAASAALILSACSGEREGTSPSTDAPDAACANAEAAQKAYQASWATTAKDLGLDNLTPVDEEVCEVDTSKWAAKPKQGDSYRIAFAAQGPTNSWGLISDEALKYRADEVGAEVLYAAANGDATTQVENIQQLASQNPDAMVVVPMGEGIAGQVKAAADQGIPVVLCSGILPASSGAVSTVTRQYDLLGSAYAEWIAQQLDGKGEVAILSGLAGVPTAEYQKAAAKRTFEKYPDIKIVTEQFTEWSPTVAKTVAQNLIATYPNLKGIWSDSGYGAMGVIQAYQEAGKPVPPITGDSFNDFLMDAQGTDANFALSTFPPEMSSTCLDTAISILKGESVLNKVFIDSPSFTAKTAFDHIRKDCDGSLPVPSGAPDKLLVKLGLCH